MGYKLLVVDIDGTLLGRDGHISAENRQALAQVKDLGIRVSLSTARVVQACWRIIEQLGLDGYHIFVDGALVKNPTEDKVVYVKPLKPELVKRAVELAHLNGVYLELHSANRFFVEQEHWSINIRRQFFGIEPTRVDFSGLWHQEEIIKVVLVVSSADEIARARVFQDNFKDDFHFSWAMTPSYPDVHFINLLDPEVSKGKALEVLASYLEVPLAEVAVAGDATNDISLFERAGLAIAMGNAPDEVKSAAHHVTLDVDQSGLAKAVRKFLLQEAD